MERLLRACERWHFRALGTLWTLVGLYCFGDLVWRSYWWDQKTPWIPMAAGLPFIIVGIGFMRGRPWARGCMLPLMIVAGLFWADMLLLGASSGNGILFWLSIGGLSAVGYTGAFALLSFCKFCHNYV